MVVSHLVPLTLVLISTRLHIPSASVMTDLITNSIEKLENQMQSFWNKINEIETQKLQAINPVLTQQKNVPNTSHKHGKTNSQKKMGKSQKKSPELTDSAKSTRQQISNYPDVKVLPNSKEIQNVTQKQLKAPAHEVIVIKGTNVNFDTEGETESESSEESESTESSEEETEKSNESSIKDVKYYTTSIPSNTTIGKRSLTSIKEAAFTPEVLEGLQKEIENVLNNRLEEIGISPEWSTLPFRSYKRAVSIIEQQANILQKDVPNYLHIRNRIIKNVDKQALERKKLNASPQRYSKLKNLLNNVKNKAIGIIQNEPNPSFARQQPPKSKLQKPPPASTLKEQKSVKQKLKPKMYMTDSESENSIRIRKTWNPPKPLDQTHKAYQDVIQELNTTVNSKIKKDQEETASEISEAILPLEEQIDKNDVEDGNNVPIKTETQAKSALRNYPSVGSLHKKKVLFDLNSSKSDHKEDEKPEIVNKVNEGGSTTSINSSVLDGSKSYVAQKSSDVKQSELSDISDWDLSDVLK